MLPPCSGFWITPYESTSHHNSGAIQTAFGDALHSTQNGTDVSWQRQHERTWIEWILSSLQMMQFHRMSWETQAEHPRKVITDSPRSWRTGYTAVAKASIFWAVCKSREGSVWLPYECLWPSNQVPHCVSVEGSVQPNEPNKFKPIYLLKIINRCW